MNLRELSDLLREFVTPELAKLGFRKRGFAYELSDPSGDAAYLDFSVMRIDPHAVVFHVQGMLVPQPYWHWLNKQHMYRDMPPPNPSGALATFSVVPPREAAHTPDEFGLSRTRWAHDGETRDRVGRVLGDVLLSESVPKLRRLLARENLLAAIRSTERPTIRRWGAVKSELVLMADHHAEADRRSLLSRFESDDRFVTDFREWLAER